jgi:multimeric flavodoxin WrbA
MMKVLIIIGSYHRQGVNAALVESVRKGIFQKAPQAQIRTVNLLDLDVQFCSGTSSCGNPDGKQIGDCVINDGMGPVLQEMFACDRLVFATPIYYLTQTALTQRFLERCLPLLYRSPMGPKPRNPIKKGKNALILVTTGAPYPFNVIFGFTKHAIKILTMTSRFCGCQKVLTLIAGAVEGNEKNKQKYLKKAYEMGRKLVS